MDFPKELAVSVAARMGKQSEFFITLFKGSTAYSKVIEWAEGGELGYPYSHVAIAWLLKSPVNVYHNGSTWSLQPGAYFFHSYAGKKPDIITERKVLGVQLSFVSDVVKEYPGEDNVVFRRLKWDVTDKAFLSLVLDLAGTPYEQHPGELITAGLSSKAMKSSTPWLAKSFFECCIAQAPLAELFDSFYCSELVAYAILLLHFEIPPAYMDRKILESPPSAFAQTKVKESSRFYPIYQLLGKTLLPYLRWKDVYLQNK